MTPPETPTPLQKFEPGDNRAKYRGDQRIVKRLEHFKKAARPKMPASYGGILMMTVLCFLVPTIQVQLRTLGFVVDIHIDSENRAYRACPP